MFGSQPNPTLGSPSRPRAAAKSGEALSHRRNWKRTLFILEDSDLEVREKYAADLALAVKDNAGAYLDLLAPVAQAVLIQRRLKTIKSLLAVIDNLTHQSCTPETNAAMTYLVGAYSEHSIVCGALNQLTKWPEHALSALPILYCEACVAKSREKRRLLEQSLESLAPGASARFGEFLAERKKSQLKADQLASGPGGCQRLEEHALIYLFELNPHIRKQAYVNLAKTAGEDARFCCAALTAYGLVGFARGSKPERMAALFPVLFAPGEARAAALLLKNLAEQEPLPPLGFLCAYAAARTSGQISEGLKQKLLAPVSLSPQEAAPIDAARRREIAGIGKAAGDLGVVQPNPEPLRSEYVGMMARLIGVLDWSARFGLSHRLIEILRDPQEQLEVRLSILEELARHGCGAPEFSGPIGALVAKKGTPLILIEQCCEALGNFRDLDGPSWLGAIHTLNQIAVHHPRLVFSAWEKLRSQASASVAGAILSAELERFRDILVFDETEAAAGDGHTLEQLARQHHLVIPYRQTPEQWRAGFLEAQAELLEKLAKETRRIHDDSQVCLPKMAVLDSLESSAAGASAAGSLAARLAWAGELMQGINQILAQSCH